MAKLVDVTPEMLLEYSKRYKEYSEQLEKMLAEMKYDKAKLFPPFTSYANYQESFMEMLNRLLACQKDVMLHSECLESVAESFLPEMSTLIPIEFY